MSKGRLSRIAAVLALAGVSLFVQASPAKATVTYNAHTWNLAAGKDTYNGASMPGRLATIQYIVGVENPLFVAFTEICQSTWDDLVDGWETMVEANAESSFVQLDDSEDGCPSNGPRGSAFFAIGTATGANIVHHLEPTQGEEARWAICRKIISTGTTWTACAAHFASNRHLAEKQADLAWDWWADVNTTPWVFGGDFNQEFGTDGLSGNGGDTNSTSATARWAYVFAEIHLRYPVNVPSLPVTYNPTEDKIDFVFAAYSHFSTGPLVDYCNNYTAYSDHRYCRGRINV